MMQLVGGGWVSDDDDVGSSLTIAEFCSEDMMEEASFRINNKCIYHILYQIQ